MTAQRKAAAAFAARRAAVAALTDEALEAVIDFVESLDEPSDDLLEVLAAAEAERDARELWNHDDGRVREAVGNYGPPASAELAAAWWVAR